MLQNLLFNFFLLFINLVDYDAVEVDKTYLKLILFAQGLNEISLKAFQLTLISA